MIFFIWHTPHNSTLWFCQPRRFADNAPGRNVHHKSYCSRWQLNAFPVHEIYVYCCTVHTRSEIKLNPTSVYLKSKGAMRTASVRALKRAPTWHVSRHRLESSSTANLCRNSKYVFPLQVKKYLWEYPVLPKLLTSVYFFMSTTTNFSIKKATLTTSRLQAFQRNFH